MKYAIITLIIIGIILTIITAKWIIGEIKLYKIETELGQRTYDSLITGIIVLVLTWGIYTLLW